MRPGVATALAVFRPKRRLIEHNGIFWRKQILWLGGSAKGADDRPDTFYTESLTISW
jgi:hypothetical protein